MTPASIISAIISTLKADSSVTALVDANNIFQGVREGIVSFPTVIVETVGDRVVEQQYPYEKIVQTFKFGAVVQVYDKDSQLESLLALKNALKKCVSNNETWGLADVIQSVCVSSADDNTNYPLRGFELNVEVTYRQNRLTRL